MNFDKDNAQLPVEALIPEQMTLESLREAAAACKACELWEIGTQTVFGEGRAGARLMMVGEQPGDREDIEGHPFVGPAGRILDEALEAAGIARADVYVTNAVKHFRWERRGKRRLHSKPSQVHIRACRPWLEAELEVVRPHLLVLLGATAAQSVMGSTFKVTQQRGKVLASPLGVGVLATVHPSSVLRSPDGASRKDAMDGLVADLKAAARHLAPINESGRRRS
ncbi:MAG: UdgX family uracil-DNA binding protein [Candidatus Dormibacteraeota bacterium]|nr:UdgX family uracil-DNA binding protein [Candidatus Dormibacteraeota bacterium]